MMNSNHNIFYFLITVDELDTQPNFEIEYVS